MLDSVPTGRRRGVVPQLQQRRQSFRLYFERECAFLICCTSVETAPSIWYIDSGASSHMTGVREHLTDLRDTEVRMEIALGDDTLVRVVGIGTVTFQRDSMPPISFRDVLYVPGLKKNLISVSTLQDRGLEVTFRGTEVLIHPSGVFACLRTSDWSEGWETVQIAFSASSCIGSEQRQQQTDM
jgi:hypothetical protein